MCSTPITAATPVTRPAIAPKLMPRKFALSAARALSNSKYCQIIQPTGESHEKCEMR